MLSKFLFSTFFCFFSLSLTLDITATDRLEIHSEFTECLIVAKKSADKFADEDALEIIKPYLIPEEHRIKRILDAIFSRGEVLASPEAMEKAGFELLLHRKGRGLVVAKHCHLKNLLVKTYLDTATHIDWTSWVRRAKGARLVQACIDAKPRCARYAKVPKKWIYQIPLEFRGVITEDHLPREFILLVEDMRLVNKEKNAEMYQTIFSEKALNTLYYLVNKSGYSDCHIGNLPFSTDGKIAFIDTEYTNYWPIHPEWLTKWFSPRKQIYWESLF